MFSFETFLEMVRSQRASSMAYPEASMSSLKRLELRIWDQRVDEAVQKVIVKLRLCHGDLALDVIGDYGSAKSKDRF
jgi:hypothetical protein